MVERLWRKKGTNLLGSWEVTTSMKNSREVPWRADNFQPQGDWAGSPLKSVLGETQTAPWTTENTWQHTQCPRTGESRGRKWPVNNRRWRSHEEGENATSRNTVIPTATHVMWSQSVQSLSRVRLFLTMNRSTPGLPVHHQLPEFIQTHVHRVSDAIQPSHPLSSPSPPAFNLQSGSFPVSQLFASGGQNIGVSASASVLPMNIQAWFPLGSTSWISLQCKGLSRVFFNTTVQKHQFFGAQLSLPSNSHIHTWPLEKP